MPQKNGGTYRSTEETKIGLSSFPRNYAENTSLGWTTEFVLDGSGVVTFNKL